jgi:hypothetical protein
MRSIPQLRATFKPPLTNCHLCGTIAESPRTRNGKGEWMCCGCWGRREDLRRAAATNQPECIGSILGPILHQITLKRTQTDVERQEKLLKGGRANA